MATKLGNVKSNAPLCTTARQKPDPERTNEIMTVSYSKSLIKEVKRKIRFVPGIIVYDSAWRTFWTIWISEKTIIHMGVMKCHTSDISVFWLPLMKSWNYVLPVIISLRPEASPWYWHCNSEPLIPGEISWQELSSISLHAGPYNSNISFPISLTSCSVRLAPSQRPFSRKQFPDTT